jgi:hypothetical protein
MSRVTLAARPVLSPALAASGTFAFPGVNLSPSRPDGYLTTAESAALIGVRPVTIRQWRARGWLSTQGLDERGRPLHTAEALRATERLVRANGIEASGVDPRRLRGRPRPAPAGPRSLAA